MKVRQDLAELIFDFIEKGFGLREEDLNEVIIRENLKDISIKYSKAIQIVQKKFCSDINIRIMEFGWLSGITNFWKIFFKLQIQINHQIFYYPIFSNRDCCVILCYSGLDTNRELIEELLPHEFAHHFQLVSEDFPCYIPKGIAKEQFYQFATTYELGPKTGSIYIDKLLLDNQLTMLLWDFGERIADFNCEMIIKRRGFDENIIKEWKNSRINSAKNFSTEPDQNIARYIKRLTLLDTAVMHAFLFSFEK